LQENVRYAGFTAEPNCSEEDVSPDGPDGGKGKGGKGKVRSSMIGLYCLEA